MTPVEIIAAIVVIAAAIKMLVLLINPSAWMNFAKKSYAKPIVIQIIGLILAGVVLYYILPEIGIVQIMAVMAFLGALLMIGLAAQVDDLIKKYESQVKKGRMWKENGLYILVWIVLLVWTAKELWM